MISLRGVLCALVLVSPAAPLYGQAVDADVKPEVAELVRAALQEPERGETWRDLAQLLPELALTDTADVVSVFEASRLADSLADAPLLPSQAIARAAEAAAAKSGPAMAATADAGVPMPTVGAWAFARRAGAWMRGVIARAEGGTLLMLAPWAAVGLLLLLGAAVRTGRIGARPRSAMATQSSPESDPKEQRRWTVTTLAESGLPPAEIARRTGMAQDAVHVLLGLRSRPQAPPSRAGAVGDFMGLPTFIQPGTATRPPSLGEQAAGIATAKAQLTRDARRLKGGRLTYGPGRVA